jgi:hypothetical protein
MLTGCDNPACNNFASSLFCIFGIFALGDGSRRELALVAFSYPTTRNFSNVVFYRRDVSLDSLSNLMSFQNKVY